jgi:L-rhamnose isomerase / sugar isomerase
MAFEISEDFVASHNSALEKDLAEDFAHLGRQLARRGVDIEAMTKRAMDYSVAIPTWGVGTGGTRFARFPGPGEPRNVFDKIDDCGVVHLLTQATSTISPHFPWDKVSDYSALRQAASRYKLGFDAVNSNTFQDQAGQTLSYKFGSLSNHDKATRQQAVAHNLECIEIGQKLGSSAITVWVGDGSNFPGQSNLSKALERYLEAASQVYAALPKNWLMFIEHKLYEPAFYSTVISDWGSNYLAAMELGPKAKCLVDLGHHAPNVNIEQIVARLIHAKKLAGFHFNDSKYGDDDLDSGSIDPFRLFLVFNELVDAERRKAPDFAPAYMIDQSHNVTDPIESLMGSAIEILRCYAQASIVDRAALSEAQERGDALGAHRLLKQAFTTDVAPILAEARRRSSGAIDPVGAYRASGYRARKAEERPPASGSSAGIV